MHAARDAGMLLFGLIWTACFVMEETQAWGYKNGILHNSIWLEQAAGVYHRESRKGRYQLTYLEARAVCKFEGGKLATYDQLEAARQIGLHVCAAGWFDRGRVGYPIVKSGTNCGFGRIGIVDYGYRFNKSERWDVYCYNPTAKECGGVLTNQQRIIQSPGFPEEYEDAQICYWHIRVRYGQQIRLRFLEFDVEEDTGCLADYLEIYDSYDDVSGFNGRFCGEELPEDILSTGNVMTLKFLSDSSVTAGGFQLEYQAIDIPEPTTSEPFVSLTDLIYKTLIPVTVTDTTPEPLIPVTDSTSEPLIPRTDTTSEPLIPGTDTTPEPLIPGTDTTPEPLIPVTDTTSEPLIPGTDTTPEPLIPVTHTTSEPLIPVTDTTSEPLIPVTDTTPEPLIPGTDTTSEPLIPVTDTTSEPLIPVTDTTSEPLIPGTDTTSEPLIPVTDTTSEPLIPVTDSTSPDTPEPFSSLTDSTSESSSQLIDPTFSSNTTEFFSEMIDPTFSSNTTESFSEVIDPTSSSNAFQTLGPMTDSTSSSHTFETDAMADRTSTSNTCEPFS